MSSDKPKKYIKVNGVMKLNPGYKAWKEAESVCPGLNGPPVAHPVTTVLNSSQALPIVASMEDYEKMNDDLGEVKFADSTNATIDMLQEPEIAAEVCMDSDNMIDMLGKLLDKYEIPIGLTNKLMLLSEYDSLEFIMDDSGSMTLNTDSNDPNTGRPMTRWQEAHKRLKEMIEIIAYVPFHQIGIEFLNRKQRITLIRNGRTPDIFMADAYNEIDAVFQWGPRGTTPAFEKLQESLLRGQGATIARYFFGDGKPNGGQQAIQAIVDLVMTRNDPESNPITFISCTNEDEAVEWMKDAEEVAPYCSESDDFFDEAKEVLRDQGAGLPYSKGFHLICQLVAAMNPDDLDAMDESVPFTKFTLDNLLGIVSNEETYQHYFGKFVEAQQARVIGLDPLTGWPSKLDEIRKGTQWEYKSFLTTAGESKLIPQVTQVKVALRAAAERQRLP